VEDGVTREFKFWIDDGWNCVKATDGNEEEVNTMEVSFLTMFSQLYVNTVLLTSSVIKPDATLDPFSHELVGDGYYSAVFGDENFTVYSYDILSKFGNVTSTYGLTELAGRLTFVLIKHDVNTTDASEEMRLTHVGLR
jgi:hypothetical protein